MQNFTADYNL